MNDHKMEWQFNLNELKAMHQDIAKLCENKKVAYLDLPFHYNVGDLLIYAGTEKFFINYGINVKYRAFAKVINHKRLDECDVILFHGGGNFGDIYIHHQNFRENIIKRYHDKRIVVLPSTIHYNSDDVLANSIKIHRAHPDLYIYCRDKKTEAIAQDFCDNVILMPDMAHSLHPLIEACEVEELCGAPKRILNMRRVDVESVSNKQVNLVKQSFDWDSITTAWDVLLLMLSHRIEALTRFYPNNKLINLWFRQANTMVFKSINYFNSFDLVSTDRMHGMILAYLLGKNTAMYDNSYGKNSSYYQQWLCNSKLIKYNRDNETKAK